MSSKPRHGSRTRSSPRPKSSKEQSKSRRRPSPRSTEDKSRSSEDENTARKEGKCREPKRRRESKDVEESGARQSPSPQRHKSGRKPRSRERFEKSQKEMHYSEEYNDKEDDYSLRDKTKRRHLSDEVDEHRQSSRSPISGRHSSGEEGAHKSNQTSPDHRRYWGRADSDSHKVSRPRSTNSDRYWSKYPVNDKVEPVGSRYYGEYSSRSRPRPLDDKENHKRKRQENDDKNITVCHRNDKKTTRESYATGTIDVPSKESSVKSDNVPPPAPRQKKNLDMLTTRTGGAYIPPARLRMMQAQITDKSSAAYQRLSWEALKKSIHGHINKVNTANIGIIVRELLKENVVRGRGLLCRSIIQAQAASPTFTHVYAALVSVINSKFPNISELLLRRLIIQFKRGFKRNDKSICISAASFIAHLVNQRVSHEILALEILTLLVESPTDDSVEVAIAFLKECGMKLMEVSNKGLHAIFEMLRNILHEGHLDKRVQYMIEVMFQVRKDNFRDHKAILDELDLVEEEDQFTHLLTLEDVKDPEDILNVFKLDPDFEENEAKYKVLKHEILDEDSNKSGSDSGSEGSEGEEESENEEDNKEGTIIDNTETNLIALRRTIYLTIHSSLDFEECAHKLMRMELKPGQEIELCHMFLDCCAEQRTYEKFYGLLSQRFCQINKIFIPPFQQIFRNTYDTIHRLDTNKLRNVAKFFAHLLFTDAISWEVLSLIHLNEEETTSSSRIFIKILFQELSEYMGLTKLNERVKDGTLQAAFEGLFPREDPKNTRFAINFFTSIGLGGLTDELREHLKSQPKVSVVPKIAETLQVPSGSGSSSSDSSSSSSSSSDSSSDSSSSSSSESEDSNDAYHRSKKSRKAGKERQTRKKKGDAKSLKKKKASVSPPKHKRKKTSR